MEKISIDEEKGETVSDGIKKLVIARLEGKEAKWEYGGIVTTTDMIPEHYMSMPFDDIELETQKNATRLRRSLIEKNTGQPFFSAHVTEEQYYEMFEKYEAEQATKNTGISI